MVVEGLMKKLNKMSLKVLIVDDDPIFVMMHKLMVKTSSIAENPMTYPNGKSALDAIAADNENEGNYLVFLDINMPIMNGWDLLNAIQQLPVSNKVYVVMITSSVEKRDKENAKRYSQVIGFYEKALSTVTCNEIKTIPAIAHFFKVVI